MTKLSAEEFSQRVFDQRLLDDTQLQNVWAEFGTREVSLDRFKQHLLGRELLTNFQIEKIERGHRAGFFYGDYMVLYLVGAGTYARVYRAAHRRTGEVVAVKVLRHRHSEDPDITEQFCREGEMGCNLRHPNIVPIFDVCNTGGHCFLVMEFVEGRNLLEFAKVRDKFEAQEATHLITDMAAGLAYAFDHGVSHRDLKMSNILISSHGRAKLVDFGLAALEASASLEMEESVSNTRTIDYAGLERASGVRKGDLRSDIYFLGCIFYQMLCGKPALYETRDRTHRLSKSRFLEVKPILEVEPTIPPIVAAIVNRAVEFDPAARYQSPSEMLSDIEVAAARLKEAAETGSSAGLVAAGDPQAELAQAAELLAQGHQRTVMIVDADTQLQDVFRERLKRNGYRVLVTSDPEWAFGRFEDKADAADCVVFNADRLEKLALDAFNRLGQNEPTESIPAVLLLSKKHHDWKADAQQADHRVVISMPIRFKQFESVLDRLLQRAKTDP